MHEKEIKDIFTNSGITKAQHIGTEVDKKNKRLSITYLIEGKKENINKLPSELYAQEWFESCKIE